MTSDEPDCYVDSLFSLNHRQPSHGELLLPLPPAQPAVYPTALYTPATAPQMTERDLPPAGFNPLQFITLKRAALVDRPKKAYVPSSPRVLSDLGDGQLYEATYSGISVYEMTIGTYCVSNHWICPYN